MIPFMRRFQRRKGKRVAILTLRLLANYGGILQNYALQTVLKRLGYQPVTILYTSIPDKCRKSFYPKLFLALIKRSIARYVLRKGETTVRAYWQAALKQRKHQQQQLVHTRANVFHTQRFIRNNIETTRYYDLPSEWKQWKRFPYSLYIVGSDQVWRYAPPYCNMILFLDFLAGRKNIKRIAYAASFGGDSFDKQRFPDVPTSVIEEYVRAFDAISTREESGIRLCKEIFGVEAEHCVDPTLLLDKEDYVKLIADDGLQPTSGQEHVMVYILDTAEEKSQICQYVADFFRLPARSFALPLRAADPPVEPVSAWLKGFSDARFVITDSFHGTIFSILFNKPFLTINNDARGCDRIPSLLSLFELQGNQLCSPADVNEEKIRAALQTDFGKVNAIRKREQDKAIAFLQHSLEGGRREP